MTNMQQVNLITCRSKDEKYKYLAFWHCFLKKIKIWDVFVSGFIQCMWVHMNLNEINLWCDFAWNLQEAVVIPPYVAFAIRPNPGFWEFVKVNSADLSVDGITSTDYLKFKEMIVDESWYFTYLNSNWFWVWMLQYDLKVQILNTFGQDSFT